MVKSLPEKLKGVTECRNIKTFVHPETSGDDSLKNFSPRCWTASRGSLAEAKRDIHLIGVSEISELLKAAFSNESIVLASLRHRFFHSRSRSFDLETAMGRADSFFRRGNVNGFGRLWNSVSRKGKALSSRSCFTLLLNIITKKDDIQKDLGNG